MVWNKLKDHWTWSRFVLVWFLFAVIDSELIKEAHSAPFAQKVDVNIMIPDFYPLKQMT